MLHLAFFLLLLHCCGKDIITWQIAFGLSLFNFADVLLSGWQNKDFHKRITKLEDTQK